MIYYINGHEPTYLQFSSGIPYSDLTILNFDNSF